MPKPLIGLSANYIAPEKGRSYYPPKELHYLERQMAEYVSRNGGVPILIPGLAAEGLADYVARCDGLIMTAGQDIGPELYGELPQHESWRGNERRDKYEWELVRQFQQARKPLLGICRGCQFLNIYFGGTLYQDITSQRPDSLVHRDAEIYDQNSHYTDIVPGSFLHALFDGAGRIRTNTVHHQGVRDLGPELEIQAVAEDGVIEAYKHRSEPFVLGIQWHPEWMDPEQQPYSDRIMEAFLAATRLPADVKLIGTPLASPLVEET